MTAHERAILTASSLLCKEWRRMQRAGQRCGRVTGTAELTRLLQYLDGLESGMVTYEIWHRFGLFLWYLSANVPSMWQLDMVFARDHHDAAVAL